VRSATKARLDALKVRVIQCLTAGAVATGAKLNITPSKYLDPSLRHQFAEHLELIRRRADTHTKTTYRRELWVARIGDISLLSAGRYRRIIWRSHKPVRIRVMFLMLCRACMRISGLRVRVVGRILRISRRLQGERTRM
jgi:hypothetical protein